MGPFAYVNREHSQEITSVDISVQSVQRGHLIGLFLKIYEAAFQACISRTVSFLCFRMFI